MSRTYRKNPRWFYKDHGKFVTTYQDRTVKGTAREYHQHEYYYLFRHDLGYNYTVLSFLGSGFYKEVTVCDSECYSSRYPLDKRIRNRTTRRCAKVDIRKELFDIEEG